MYYFVTTLKSKQKNNNCVKRTPFLRLYIRGVANGGTRGVMLPPSPTLIAESNKVQQL